MIHVVVIEVPDDLPGEQIEDEIREALNIFVGPIPPTEVVMTMEYRARRGLEIASYYRPEDRDG